MAKTKLRRIHIIGGPGSGKSYLAGAIAKRTKNTPYNLDDIYWDNAADKYGVRADEKKRAAELKSILSHKDWVVEGVYYEWLLKSFKKADIIVVLRPSPALRAWRIITRYILRKTGLLRSQKKETLKGLFKLLGWNRDFDKINLAAAEKIFKKYNLRYIELKNDSDVKKFIERLN